MAKTKLKEIKRKPTKEKKEIASTSGVTKKKHEKAGRDHALLPQLAAAAPEQKQALSAAAKKSRKHSHRHLSVSKPHGGMGEPAAHCGKPGSWIWVFNLLLFLSSLKQLFQLLSKFSQLEILKLSNAMQKSSLKSYKGKISLIS